jgi:hypothetical protein
MKSNISKQKRLLYQRHYSLLTTLRFAPTPSGFAQHGIKGSCLMALTQISPYGETSFMPKTLCEIAQRRQRNYKLVMI